MSKAKVRTDLLLVQRGLVPSRHQAAALILAGRVLAGGKKILKAGEFLDPGLPLEVLPGRLFVSRGGEKLQPALEHFRIDPKGLMALDCGASTGGFTDCLLQMGVKRVFAIDVGSGQFDTRLKRDPRVVLMEKTNIRYLDSLPEEIDLATLDVSFISLSKVLPTIVAFMKGGGRIVALVKPQFELSPKEVKKGVVRDPSLQEKAVRKIEDFAQGLGLEIDGECPSPLAGPKGNREVFLLLKVPLNKSLSLSMIEEKAKAS